MKWSRDVAHLRPIDHNAAMEVLSSCAKEGVDLLVTCTYRPPEVQAVLYRQSRTAKAIENKVAQLREHGYYHLAEIIWSVGPQWGELGKHVTHAGPGESWHNFGRAMDVVPLVNGKPCWDDQHEAWEIFGRVAVQLGFTWGGNWSRFREMPHIQSSSHSSPLKFYSNNEAVVEALFRASPYERRADGKH